MSYAEPEIAPENELAAFKRNFVLISCAIACASYLFLPGTIATEPWLTDFHQNITRCMAAVSVCFFLAFLKRPAHIDLLAQVYFVVTAFYFSASFGFILFRAPPEKDAIALGLMTIAPFVPLPIIWSFAFFSSRRAMKNSLFYTALLALTLIAFVLQTPHKPNGLVLNALNQIFILANFLTIACVVVFSRLTDSIVSQQLKHDALESVALSDALTNLPNRRFMQRVLQNELVRFRRYKSPFFVAMLDLDEFKRVNDEFGHATGDRVLQAAARVFKSTLSERNWIGRWGGEEFLAILPDCSEGEAERLLEQVRAALADYREEGLPAITVSVGLGQAHSELADIGQLIKEADIALYRAKSQGRNRLALFR